MGLREPDDYDPLEGADVIVRGRFENQRLAVVPMEGGAVAVVPGDDGEGHDLTVYLACQMPHSNRNALANGLRARAREGAARSRRTSAVRSGPSTGTPKASSRCASPRSSAGR